MSTVYDLAPPTKGKVVLRTTLGDLDIELWPKEAPRAVRNFVQLCLEGYYDGAPFHRVDKDFLVQGGDPSGTGGGGESAFGAPFADEFHSRLRFAHRGVVALANQNRPCSNGSQFFITLDRADALNRKATIFGKVTGDSLFNLARFNELEVDAGCRPLEPPALTRAEVLWNPFDDVVPRVDRAAKEAAAAAAAAAAPARPARAAAKNLALISFGDEEEEEDEGAAGGGGGGGARGGMVSAHDALEDARLSREAAVEVDLGKVRAAMRAASRGGGGGGAGAGGAGAAAAPAPAAPAPAVAAEEEEAKPDYGDDGDEDGGAVEEGEAPAAAPAPAKRARLTTGASAPAALAPSKQLAGADAELLSAWEARRQGYRERRRLGGARDADTLAKLQGFVARLKGGAAAAAAAGGTGGAEGGSAAGGSAAATDAYDGRVAAKKDLTQPAAWRIDAYAAAGAGASIEALVGHRLTFARAGGGARDAMARSDDVDDYEVLDPLAAAAGAFDRRRQGEKKRENEWAGRAPRD
jgi:peptidyl-prolyl cis-trans isomerase SDCCAG10